MKSLINETAERVIIAGLIRNPDDNFIKARAENIGAKHFRDYRCAQLFTIIDAMYSAGHVFQIQDIAISPEIKGIKATDEHIIHDILEIESSYSGAAHWQSYLPMLKKAKATRDAYGTAQEALAMIENNESPDVVADALRAGGDAAMMALEAKKAWKDAKEATKEFCEEFEILRNPDMSAGIVTGMEELDRLTGGMRGGELWVICGQTSTGKSVAALQLGSSAISQGKQTALFSLEMGAGENIARIISTRWGVHFGAIRNPREQRYNSRIKKWASLTKKEDERIQSSAMVMKDSTLRVCDEGGLTIERIEAICKEMHEREPLELIIIDYVQLVTTTRKGFATHEELGWLVGRMKQMAKTYDCPVITASQLNDDGKLAQSRAIGHHADVVMRIEGDQGIYMYKNRNGQRDIYVPLKLDGAYQKFIEIPNYQQNS